MEEELRLAVVMNGGVSLAVWIGGATLEISRVVGGESAYGEIQALTDTRTRVDVICGTSAGGVNGAFLAMGMANHPDNLPRSMGILRPLWVGKGSIGELLRDPFASNSTSLLDGDGYFLESLREAFRTLKTSPISNPHDVPVNLIMTTTLLRGLEREYSDDFGSRIRDVTHRGTFKFSRGPGFADDVFSADDIADQLALAARSTASFPAAFEPSFCPVDTHTDHPFRPDMKGLADFPTSRFVLDGGVLDNSPLDLALEHIYNQRATGPVRRVLAFVVPDPGTTARKLGDNADEPDQPDEQPELLDVGIASLVQIPAAQSISTQLEQLRKHNERVRARRRARILLTRHNDATVIDGLAETLFPTYRAQRISDAIDYLTLEINHALVLKGNRGLGRHGRREWLRRTIADFAPNLPWVPAHAPLSTDAGPEQSIEGWRWGTRPVEHLAKVLLDIAIRTQRLSSLLSYPSSLEAVWKAAYQLVENADEARKQDRNYWRTQADGVLEVIAGDVTSADRAQRAREWVRAAIAGWRNTPYQKAPSLLHQIAEQLLGLRETISGLSTVATTSRDRLAFDQAQDLRCLFEYFVRGANDTIEEIVARLLAFEVTQEALGGRGTFPEQEIEFIEISARTRSTFGGPEEPSRKLAGIQLAHFGAFYKSSWRANDWMWGRVDAVHRLVRILLDPERLRIASRKYTAPRAEAVAAEIRRIATQATNEALRTELQQLSLAHADFAAELAYLDDDAAIVPESLPLCVAALSRRLEGEILISELPQLAGAASDDCQAGCFGSEAAQSFLTRCGQVTTGGIVQAAHLSNLLAMCSIGSEKLEREVGTDRLSVLATQAIAVAVSAARVERGLLAFAGKLLTALRMPALLFYVFARAAQYRSGTGVAIMAALGTAGVVIIATQAFADKGPYGKALLGIGIAALLAPILWAALRWPGIARKTGAVLAVLVLGFVVAVLFGVLTLPVCTVRTWQNIAAGTAGLLVLLLVSGFGPVLRRP